MIGFTFVPKEGCIVSVIGKFLNSDKYMCCIINRNVVPIVLTEN